MCEGCHTAICYDGCPFYEADADVSICEVCGEPLDEDGIFYVKGDSRLCDGCAAQLSVDDLLDLGGLCGVGELLALLGYRRA